MKLSTKKNTPPPLCVCQGFALYHDKSDRNHVVMVRMVLFLDRGLSYILAFFWFCHIEKNECDMFDFTHKNFLYRNRGNHIRCYAISGNDELFQISLSSFLLVVFHPLLQQQF